MKKFLLLFIAFVGLNLVFAEKLILISFQEEKELKNLFSNQEIKINYYTDNLIIATVNDEFAGNYILLDNNCWTNHQYFIAWFHKGVKDSYPSQVSEMAEIVIETDSYLFLKAAPDVSIHPPIDGRITKIKNIKISFPEKKFTYTKGSVKNDPEIEAMLADVNMTIYMQNLQHLQDYGTRNAYHPNSVQAQNWIKQQFESYGYTVELFDFPMPQGPASDNVIATKPGSKYPDEYVVIGGHYDSYSYSGNAPGADDDASGVCGVMEVARVMANWDSDRTILFCAWSGEEYGLYGSGAYAQWCATQGLNILGYFNIDMCGYRHPGDPIHTDMIAPASAQPLVQFYTDVCAMYLPDFIIDQGNLTGGDSDHTSFNNAGYMGIFPFEDSQNYSPYIHTANDVIGTSMNSPEMASYFTRAMVASVASMANYLAPPSNLIAVPGNEIIDLSWDPLFDIDNYNVYKNNQLIASTPDPSYTDTDVQNFTTYTYYVTAIYSETGEESNPSNMVTVTPLPPMSFPFVDDFESGALYWNFEGTWGLSTNQSHSSSHSMTESPVGNYGNNMDISSTLYSFSLENAQSASMSFWTKYALEANYDYTYLQISTTGTNWTTLESFTGTLNSWTNKTYSLDAYLGEPFVQIRFRFTSDSYVTANGMFIDDFELTVQQTGTGLNSANHQQSSISIFPNPMSTSAVISIENLISPELEISFYSTTGFLIERNIFVTDQKNYSYEFRPKELKEGIYYCVMRNGNAVQVRKVTIIR